MIHSVNRIGRGTMNQNMDKYRTADLERLARETLVAAGLEREKALVVAHGLLEGDLMGASTHGLALLPGYADCFLEHPNWIIQVLHYFSPHNDIKGFIRETNFRQFADLTLNPL